MKKFFWLLLIFGSHSFAQCFDCNKNIGGWTGDAAMDVELLPDGLVNIVTSGGFTAGYINKYDFNCNLLWSKTFGYDDVVVQSVTSDPAGNIYLMILNTTSTNAGMGPWNVSGFMMSPGMNFYKLDPMGNIIWRQHIARTSFRLSKIVFSQNILYVTGTFFDSLTFPTVSFTHTYTDYPRAFVAKYDTNGNFIDATEHGSGRDIFGVSEVDLQGNTYLTYNTPNYEYSRVDKIDANLDVAWSTTLTSAAPGNNNPSIYNPTGIRFNKDNQKLYLWGGMNLDADIMGHQFHISESNGIFQSALTEFDTSNGALTHIRRFDNNSRESVPAINGTYVHKSAFMAEKNGSLYLLTSFSGTMAFSNGVATSTTYYGGAYDSEELLLMKINLSDFTPELVMQSHGVQNLSYAVTDHPGKILFHGDELYLTATFSSNPMNINGSVIHNNSGNNASDGMLYKYNILNAVGSGSITTQHTCLNDQTDFSLSGTYDSVTWNFGEPASANNVSTATNPQHQYLSAGTYRVKAVVICGTNTQTVEKSVVITPPPYLNAIPALTACEDSPGSGISSYFDTAGLHYMLVGTQPNVAVAFFTTAGQPIASPLPNPFTNTVANNQTIVARAFFAQNPGCYVERPVSFTTQNVPVAPTAIARQTFCIQQNAVVDDLVASAPNVIWHDAPFAGYIIPGSTALTDGTTYYGSLANAICESARIPVTVSIQSTLAPAGAGTQLFCALANPTLADVAAVGDTIKWYDSVGGIVLAPTTRLIDGMTYYATQTVNGCESITHLTVTVEVQSTLHARNVSEVYCDDDNDGLENIDLNSFQLQLIDHPEQYHFSFFETFPAAENETGEILNSYQLLIGNSTVFCRITSGTGCFEIVRIEMHLYKNPKIDIPDTVPLCKDVGSATIDAGNFDSYQWSTGEISPSISVSIPGSYSVIVTENHTGINCTATKNFEVFLSDAPEITDVRIQEWTSGNNSIVIQTDSMHTYEYSIDGISFQDSNTFEGLLPGSYTVFVRDVYRCGISTAEVELLMYPEFFTPNGDGYNDQWAIPFAVLKGGMTTIIFDRFGKKIYQMSGNESWNGTVGGKAVPSDDYWFVTTLYNGKARRGHFSLKR